jgi:hypothetical protein
MTRYRAGLAAVALVLVLIGASALGISRVFAAGQQPPGPDRYTVITVDYTSYEWWLVGWADSSVDCQIFIDHDGLPTDPEILNSCGDELHNQWAQTKPCDQSEKNPVACRGEYLQLASSRPAQRKIGVNLPPPVVWVTLEGCAAVDLTNRCNGLPILVLTGEEPLPNEHITGIGGTLNGKSFSCDATCQVDLVPTDEAGMKIEFWAYSSYGDSSEAFEAQVRVAAGQGEDAKYWYADVISTQWRGAPQAACSQTWDAFPPVGGPPAWLSTPQRVEDLASSIPYDYLAANLITQGVVDASSCPDGGLLENGLASTCGITKAQPAVVDWQNRFDQEIFSAALKSDIPAQLLKNLFSRESQFWPGVFTDRPEAGLGQLTDNGADTTLLWNPSFYEQYCPLVLADKYCHQGYALLDPEQQAILRGALVHSVDATCADCPAGLDLTQADFSVTVFAETLAANCEQAGMIVQNATGQTPGEAGSYEDLWRFTLVNYNAGPGCLTLAVQATVGQGEPLDWEDVSSNLTPTCQGAVDYVDTISR